MSAVERIADSCNTQRHGKKRPFSDIDQVDSLLSSVGAGKERMNWEALGAIGEVAGAIAVVVTLFYLARQIKHSNTVSSANVYQERANTRMHLHQSHANSEYVAPILLRLEELGWPENVDAIEELSNLELYRFKQNQFASMVRFDNSYYQYRNGFLDADAWKLTQLGMRSMGPTWIRLGILRTGATEPFVEEVARLVGEADNS